MARNKFLSKTQLLNLSVPDRKGERDRLKKAAKYHKNRKGNQSKQARAKINQALADIKSLGECYNPTTAWELMYHAITEMSGHLFISISGGKDGDAMLKTLTTSYAANLDQMTAIHADLGKAEWKETPAHVEQSAKAAGIPLVVVRRENGDLVDRIQERLCLIKGQNKPHWPSADNRYCTSDLKRNPINKEYRASNNDLVISAEGIRKLESPARAKKPILSIRQGITSKHYDCMTIEEAMDAMVEGKRLAFSWYPIFLYTEEQVWNTLGHTTVELGKRRTFYKMGSEDMALDGWSFHPAYVYGNVRLSCAICVLACKSDIMNGAKHNPELFEIYKKMERDSGFTFKQGFALSDLNLNEKYNEQPE